MQALSVRRSCEHTFAMDRETLKTLLAEGLSVERIAKRFRKHPSTVAYWLAKHGLQSTLRDKHAAKGGIERERLEKLVDSGLSITQLAAELGLSKSTVRYWLGRYGLRTLRARRTDLVTATREAGVAVVTLTCARHGETDFVVEGQRLLPMQALSRRSSHPASSQGQGDPRSRGWWPVPLVRL